MIVLKDAWIGKVPEPNTVGEPEIKYDTISGLWRVVGPNTLKRVPNAPDMSRVPETTQFYNKILKHEEEHVEQYATGMLSDLYRIENVMPRIYQLSDPNQQVLETKAFDVVEAWRKEQFQILRERNTKAEIEAHKVSDLIPPLYIIQLECKNYGQ